jgi:hypothetical protein
MLIAETCSIYENVRYAMQTDFRLLLRRTVLIV